MNYTEEATLNRRSRRRSASARRRLPMVECASVSRASDPKRPATGLQPSLIRTHYSAGRVSALLNMPPQTLSLAQKRYLDAFLRFCPGVTNCADLFSSFEPCCAGEVPRD